MNSLGPAGVSVQERGGGERREERGGEMVNNYSLTQFAN